MFFIPPLILLIILFIYGIIENKDLIKCRPDVLIAILLISILITLGLSTTYWAIILMIFRINIFNWLKTKKAG